MKKLAFLSLFALVGCYGMSDDEDRIVPVTNNRYVVPSHGGGFPGTSSGDAGGPN